MSSWLTEVATNKINSLSVIHLAVLITIVKANCKKFSILHLLDTSSNESRMRSSQDHTEQSPRNSYILGHKTLYIYI